jgi:hypothetical protein
MFKNFLERYFPHREKEKLVEQNEEKIKSKEARKKSLRRKAKRALTAGLIVAAGTLGREQKGAEKPLPTWEAPEEGTEKIVESTSEQEMKDWEKDLKKRMAEKVKVNKSQQKKARKAENKKATAAELKTEEKEIITEPERREAKIEILSPQEQEEREFQKIKEQMDGWIINWVNMTPAERSNTELIKVGRIVMSKESNLESLILNRFREIGDTHLKDRVGRYLLKELGKKVGLRSTHKFMMEINEEMHPNTYETFGNLDVARGGDTDFSQEINIK